MIFMPRGVRRGKCGGAVILNAGKFRKIGVSSLVNAETGQVKCYFTSPVTRLNVQVPTVLQPGATKQSGNTIKYFGSDIGVCSSRTQGPRRAALRPSLHLDTT